MLVCVGVFAQDGNPVEDGVFQAIMGFAAEKPWVPSRVVVVQPFVPRKQRFQLVSLSWGETGVERTSQM